MNGTLVKRISLAVLAILALVIFSSAVAVIAAIRSRTVMQALHHSLLNTRAAEELEISLLEQRGVVSAYLLDNGNEQRLRGLSNSQQAFNTWLEQSRELAEVSNQRSLLADLESVYDRYVVSRNRVIALYDAGEHAAAAELLLDDVNRLYSEAYILCEQIISNNEALVDDALANMDWSTRIELWLVFTSAIASALLTGWLLHSLFYSILRPLRTMVQEARSFQLESSGLAINSPGDELRAIGFYLQRLMSDVTDARSTLVEHRARLKHSESLASVGKLASCVAHEIRNPLTAIKMWLFSAQQSLPNRTPQREMIAKSLEEIHRLEHVVQHFLEFARPPALNLQTTFIKDLVYHSLELANPVLIEKEIQLELKLSEEPQAVEVDAHQMTQVISNLLLNAIDASSPGQRIEISLELHRAHDIDWQVLKIADQGKGIPESARDRIFEPFFTTKDDGTGLGLCIAANIMGRHRGRLALESPEVCGTVFSVWIPIDGKSEC